MAVLTAAHLCVLVVFAARLAARLPRLCGTKAEQARKVLASACAHAITLGAATKPGADTREAAQSLGRELAEPDTPEPPMDEDLALAVDFACTDVADAVGAAGEAQLALEARLAARPPDEARA
eukprot:gnl/Chilomastix_cuspidata/5633.p2 GENE.gnl/Chilomastix_cuspidata/5633~~gnl/Chilomastix_cuspidata/5633.p2  ORF type:complete len:123 (+),score=18.18 gnl/Chilomastix_cuspidata/5633:97-465(+)